MRGFKVGACSAVLVIAFAVAGCGSDDSSSDSTITKSEFITQANEICASSNKAIDTASEDAFSSNQPSDAEIESFVNETVIPEVETQLTEIRDLGAPEGEEDQVNAILDAVDSALEESKADPISLVGGSDPFAEANKLSEEYGLNECAG